MESSHNVDFSPNNIEGKITRISLANEEAIFRNSGQNYFHVIGGYMQVETFDARNTV